MATHIERWNTYTQSPRLHSNLILSSLQLIAWILFRPLAWNNYVKQLDETLPPDCTLIDAYSIHWRHPLFRRILVAYSVYIVLIIAVSIVTLLAFGQPSYFFFMSILGPLLVAAVLFTMGGVSFNIAVGMALSVPGSLIFAVGTAVLAGTNYPMHFTPKTAIVYGLVLGLGGSLAGSVASNISSRRSHFASSKWSTWISGTIASFLIGGTVVFTMYSLLRSIANAFYGDFLHGQETLPVPFLVILLLVLVLIMTMTIGWRRARFILLINLVTFFISLIVLGILHHVQFPQFAHIGFVLVFMAVIGLPYTIMDRVLGPRIGISAATLGLGVGWLFWTILMLPEHSWDILIPGFACILAGLTIHWWGAFLIHPFLEIWNLLLLRLDEQRLSGKAAWLPWHAAFWNETHRLVFHNLDEHLVLVAENNSSEGQAAIAYLSTGHQRLAAQSAQIELYARRLERCSTIEEIANMPQSLVIGELESPVSALLRGYSRVAQEVHAALSHTTNYHKRIALGRVENRLYELLGEMTVSSNPYTPRFRPITTRWYEIVADYRDELTETIEKNQQIANPYVVGVPLTENQEIFVGRTDVAARIELLLLNHHSSMLLYGQRRMGKTSLLRNLGHLLPSSTVMLFVDGEVIAGTNDFCDLLYSMASAMAKSADHHRHMKVPRLNRAMLEVSPLIGFNEWLDQFEQSMDAQGINMALLALDEFEALDAIQDKSRFDQTDLLRLARNVIQHRTRFKVLLAGSHTLEEFRHWASYLINLQVIKISYLEEKDVLQLIEAPVKDFPLHYKPDASQRVLMLTRGHPHLVQLLCSEIVELKNSQPIDQRRLVTLEDVEAAISRALDVGDLFFADIDGQIGETGSQVLRFIASHGERTVVDHATLAATFPHDLDDTLELLLRRDVLEQAHNGYQFQVELIRCWFARYGRSKEREQAAISR